VEKRKLKSKKTGMLRTIGKQSGREIRGVSPEEEKEGYGVKKLLTHSLYGVSIIQCAML